MKLTMTKVSIPVLMMMIQSADGTGIWGLDNHSYMLERQTKHLHEKAIIQIPNDQHRTTMGAYLLYHFYPSRANWRYDHYLFVYRYSTGFYSCVQKFEKINTTLFLHFVSSKRRKSGVILLYDIFIQFSSKNKQINYFYSKKSRILFAVSIFIFTFAAVFRIQRNKLT